MSKTSAMPKLTKRTPKVISVDLIVSSARAGVRAIAMIKPTKLAVKLIKPQLMVSPTPSSAVYMTAISYATKRIGRSKKP